MRVRTMIGSAVSGVVVGVLLVLGATAARAQGSCTFTDETGKTVTWPNCRPPAETKAPASPSVPGATPATPGPKSFPYPGSEPAATAPAPAVTAPASTQSPAPASPAGPRNFPFPGSDDGSNGVTPGSGSGGGAKPLPPGDGLKDAGSSGESSSSSSSSSSGESSSGDDAAPVDNDPAAKAAAARHARRSLPTAARQSPSEREEEDLRVAGFYQNDGNFKGAYLRAQDAVSIAGDDPDAHFALAEAARKLGKLDEAQVHYKRCLTLDPIPKERKAAEKALKEMEGG